MRPSDIDLLSLTWIALKAEMEGDRAAAVEQLIVQGICPRQADVLRGRIDYIDNLLAFGSHADEREIAP